MEEKKKLFSNTQPSSNRNRSRIDTRDPLRSTDNNLDILRHDPNNQQYTASSDTPPPHPCMRKSLQMYNDVLWLTGC